MFETKEQIKQFIEDRFSKVEDLTYLQYHPNEYPSDYSIDDFTPFIEIRDIVGADWVRNGVSKVVFGWNDISDFVVKVPFIGEGYYQEDNFLADAYSFNCASNSKDCSDYCCTEEEVYAEAEEVGIENFFAATELICEIDDVKFYIAEKAREFHWGDFPTISEDSREKAKGSDGTSLLDVSFLGIFYEQNEDKSVDRMIQFLRDFELNDFHSGNLGYINDRLVFIDYSGYNE